VRLRLIYLSVAEMDQLVGLSFPTLIRPWLMDMAADATAIPHYRVRAIQASEAYRLLLRQTLFLGLSDGAHTGRFRRFNPFLSNEQVWHAYEISEDKAADFKKKLRKDLEELLGREPSDAECRYRNVVLLDDFTARVDSNTERKILENVHRNYPGITLLSVTQKIASVEDYDQIVLLMEGEVLATGTHKQLMETSPEYVQIYDSQRSTSHFE